MARLIVLASLAASLSGCGRVWLPEEIERRVGDMMSREMVEAMPIIKDHPWNAFVQDAGRKLAAVSERPGYDYRFLIVESSQINAFACPNGEIFITSGLLKAAGRDQEAVASVLGHEIGHIARRHTCEALQSKMGLGTASVLLFGFDRSAAQLAASLLSDLTVLGYGRDMESEADLCSIRYLTLLGFPPETGLKFLKTMEAHEHDKLPSFLTYFQSHPPMDERLRYAEAYAQVVLAPPAADATGSPRR